MMHTVLLGNVCDLKTGGTPSKARKEYFEDGDIKWLVSGDINKNEIFECDERITEAGLKNSNARFLPVNSVMIALNGQGKTRGTVAMLRMKATCNQSLVSIYPKDPNKLLPEYIFQNLKGRYEEIRKMTGDSGNERRGLNMQLIRSIKISVPESIEEQRRIVKKLDEAFEKIDKAKANTEKNLKNSQELFASKLNQAISNSQPSWIEDRLENLSTKIGSGATPKGGRSAYRADGISLIRSLNVYDNGFRVKNLAFLGTEQAKRLNNVELKEKDILLNITGASVARCCVVPADYLPGRVNQHVSIIRAIQEKVYPEFLHYLLISQYYKKKLFGIGEAAGTTRQAITKKQIQDFMIACPKDITEQKSIVDKLYKVNEQTQKLQKLYQHKLDDLAELKQSILKQAFEGKL